MRSQKSEQYKIKKHKDLIFLTQKQQQKIGQNIFKYVLTQGKGQIIKDLKLPLTIYYSYDKYDYTGLMIQKVLNKSINYPKEQKKQSEPLSVIDAIFSMKLNQKSWFNIQFAQKDKKQFHGFNGYHFEMFIDKIIYKNDVNIQSKRMIYQTNRQMAKQLFKNKKYKEAIKIYRNSINILKGLSKKNYNQLQLVQLKQYLEKSQSNYMKCLAKINGIGGRYDQQIAKLSKEISQKYVSKNPNDPISYYQKAIHLKYECRFDDAVQSIQQALKKPFPQNVEEANQIKKTLSSFKQQIKQCKQRNIRHIKRQQIRKKKTIKMANDIWYNNTLMDQQIQDQDC